MAGGDKAMKGISQIGRRSAAAAAADAIRTAIVEGKLAMGQALSEAALGQSLGVSRTPLREALMELEGQGLVEIEPYKGARVFSLTADEIQKLGDFRKLLELHALELAMRNSPAELKEDLRALVERMDELFVSNHLDEYGALDTQLHERFIVLSDNPFIWSAYQFVGLKLAVFRNFIPHNRGYLEAAQVAHKALLENVLADRVEDALEVLGAHIDGGTANYCAKVEQAVRERATG